MNIIDNEENTDTKTRLYKNFDASSWKTNDKAWIKERRVGWSSVKYSLDHMFTHNRNIFRDKKPYKYIKQFYLTGSIDFPEEIGGISYIKAILDMNSPLDMWYAGGDIGGLLECWLTPEPSVQKWEQIFERYEAIWKKRKEPENIGKIFEECRICYRNALVNWYTEPNQVSLFGDIENDLIAFFKPFPRAKNFHDYLFYWETLMPHYLRACDRGRENAPTYNVNHPIYDNSKELVNTLIPYYIYKDNLIKEQNNSERKIEYYTKKLLEEFSIKFDVIIDVINNAEKFSIKQVEFANDFMTGTNSLDFPDDLRKVFQKAKESS